MSMTLKQWIDKRRCDLVRYSPEWYELDVLESHAWEINLGTEPEPVKDAPDAKDTPEKKICPVMSRPMMYISGPGLFEVKCFGPACQKWPECSTTRQYVKAAK